MQFVINDHTFEAASLERVTGAIALDLPRQAGIGLKQLATRVEEMGRLGYDESGTVVVLPEGASGGDANAVLDSEPHLRALLAFLWVSRRLGGEPRLTWDEACDFPITTMQIIDDADDEAEDVEPDPTLPGSAPVAAATSH